MLMCIHNEEKICSFENCIDDNCIYLNERQG